MSRLSTWLHLSLTLVDSWFMWGVFFGVLTVAQLVFQGVPGIALYGWLIPLLYGLLLTEDTWHVWVFVGMFMPWLIRGLIRELVPLLAAM